MTMADSGKVNRLLLKIANNARRRRLEIRRMNSVLQLENFKDGINSHFTADDYVKKIRRVIKEVTSNESTTPTGKVSGIDGGKLTSKLSLSASYSPQNEGMPVGILVAGGEVAGEEDSRNLTCLSHGSISVIGRRREMEDAVTVAPGVLAGETASYDFFAVYDGHGGSRVAHACRDRLHQLLAKEIEGWTGGGGGGIDWEKVMAACFSKMDDEVKGGGVQVEDGSVSVKTMGSTAVVVMVGKEEVVVANCGDSRAILCRGGVALPLSRDHKPDRPDERERVEAAGGRVINWNGCRVLGVLATSRSIGDHYLKPYVISEPEVTVSKQTKSDDFLIIATDGLWDVVSNQLACEVVRRCLDGQMRRRSSEGMNESSATEAAAILAELAMARGSKDNISVIVVELKKSSYGIS